MLCSVVFREDPDCWRTRESGEGPRHYSRFSLIPPGSQGVTTITLYFGRKAPGVSVPLGKIFSHSSSDAQSGCVFHP